MNNLLQSSIYNEITPWLLEQLLEKKGARAGEDIEQLELSYIAGLDVR